MEKQEKRKIENRIVIGVCVAIFIVGISMCIGIAVALNNGIKKGVNKTLDWFEKQEKKQREREELYDSMPNVLFERGFLPSDWIYVAYQYGWVREHSDGDKKDYIYIPEDKYEDYKYYWLEDISPDDYEIGLNCNLSKDGDYVFHVVEIVPLSYVSPSIYNNINIDSNYTYYVAIIYDKALYYKQVEKDYDNKPTRINTGYELDSDSKLKSYILHKENNYWVVEEGN